MPTISKSLGDKIQIKRFEKGLLQSQVAKELNVATARVKSWEANFEKPSQAQWLELVKLLGLVDGLNTGAPTAL
ncbi:MAG: hypothetical protein JWQ71_2639 [Pedosphaera sp.]|nr:hypothetical protein [Pedosphaera sp.]